MPARKSRKSGESHCVTVRQRSVREFRGAVVRGFRGGKIQTGIHFQIASGYAAQTTEVLALPGEGDAFERVVGVYIPSYATLSFSYRFGRP